MPSNHLILWHLLLLLLSIFPSISIFSNELTLGIRWSKYWSFSSSLSNEYWGLISFQLTGLISLLSKRLLGVFFSTTIKKHKFYSTPTVLSLLMAQLSYPYMSTRKTIALTIWTFLSKVMSLLFNMLFRFVIAFLPRSKHLLILWLQSPSPVMLEPKKIKSATVSIVSHLFAMKWCDWMPWSSFLNADF